MSDTVLDASALLKNETGAELAAQRIREGNLMSTVNLAEVLAPLLEGGFSRDGAWNLIQRLPIRIEPFTPADALGAALLRPLTRPLCLSLGGRACLALAQRLGKPAVTADRAWTTLQLSFPILLIR